MRAHQLSNTISTISYLTVELNTVFLLRLINLKKK